MTTQTEITKSHQAPQAPLQIKISIWPLVLAVLLIVALIGVAIVVIPTRGEDINSRGRALEAISARYQGLANLHAAKREADSQIALESISARYQGLADLYQAREE